MKKHGFSAIHNPTSILGRSYDTTFTQHGTGLFDLLHDILDKSDHYVKAREEEAAFHKSKKRRKE
jgi:hypothetical protein